MAFDRYDESDILYGVLDGDHSYLHGIVLGLTSDKDKCSMLRKALAENKFKPGYPDVAGPQIVVNCGVIS